MFCSVRIVVSVSGDNFPKYNYDPDEQIFTITSDTSPPICHYMCFVLQFRFFPVISHRLPSSRSVLFEYTANYEKRVSQTFSSREISACGIKLMCLYVCTKCY